METKVVLDSTLLVDFMRKKEHAIAAVNKLSEGYELCTTAINVFELFYGANLGSNIEKNIAATKGMLNTLTVFNTNQESMETAGRLLAGLEKKGQKIEIRDVLIAAICLSNSLPIVTANKKHFESTGVNMIEL